LSYIIYIVFFLEKGGSTGAPLTLIPLDATQDAPVTMVFYKTFKDQQASPEAAFVYDLMTTRLDLIKSGGLQFWDSLTAAIATDESLADFETFEIQVVEEEGSESGYTRPAPGGARVRAAITADGSRFEATLLSILNLP
jgi:inosine-uridine nucleoside N-ribohydrolase